MGWIETERLKLRALTLKDADAMLETLNWVSLIRAENMPLRRVAERNGMKVERQVIFHDLPHLLYATRRETYGEA